MKFCKRTLDGVFSIVALAILVNFSDTPKGQVIQEEFFLNSFNLEDGTDIFCRNVGNQLPTYTA
jgi:hypothetical protein